MSLLKVNEVQNYNGSSLTLTASTVSTSAQLNTGGNISVTGSVNVSDDSTTRSNLGLGSIATQASDNVTITGGNISNATLASSVTFPAGKVLQVIHTQTTETNVLDNTYTNYFEVPLTLKSSSSDVIVTFTFQYFIVSANAGFGVEIYRGDSAGVTTSDTAVWTRNLRDTTGPYTFYLANGGLYSVSSITGKDTITGKSAGDTIYYGLFARRYINTITIYFPPDGATEDGFFSSLIMEVQK